MDSQEIFLTCLNNLQEARLFFEQGLTDDAMRILATSLRDLDDIGVPEEKHRNLRQQIESYLETLKGVCEISESDIERESLGQENGGLDLQQLFKHALALMDNRLWEEAIRELQIITAYGYQTMECLELCGDASVFLEKWEDALGYYETFGLDPSIGKDDRVRLHAKIARCRDAIAKRMETRSQISERAAATGKESQRETSVRVAVEPRLQTDEPATAMKKEPGKKEERPAAVEGKDLFGDNEAERLLNIILRRIHEAKSFEDILPQLEKQMLKFLGAERLTIYQRGRNGREIISRYKTGAEVREIRLPISPSSIAGYVALTQQSLKINNVHERSLLASIHPELEFDRSFDASTGFHTRSMITVPIKQGDTPLGVLQVINCVGKNAFDDLDLKSVEDLARVIGQKFYYDLQATKAPFDHLIITKKITPEK
ncbi:MAG TPA: hypothetical protein DEO88_08715, partial [Syntrophobacteraceae bacterium]|nr:hypothetical protein [Syntrophobacteraceae bacterium]